MAETTSEQFELQYDPIERSASSAAEPSPAAPPPPQPKHSAYLVRMAREFGASDEQIDAASDEQLHGFIEHNQREALRLAREYQASERIMRQQDRPLPESRPEPEPDEYDPKWSEGEYDPIVKKGIEWASQAQKKWRDHKVEEKLKRLEELEERLNKREQADQQEKLNKYYDQLDSLFASRPDIFSKHTRHTVGQDANELEKRRAIVNSVTAKLQEPGSVEEKFNRVVNAIYGAKREPEPAYGEMPAGAPAPRTGPPRAANGRFTRQQLEEEWGEAGLHQPTNYEPGPEPRGEKKAIKTAARMLREQGLVDEQDLTADHFLD